jgi:hypothetical protein
MDKKPKSLMVAEGTTQAMTAEAASTARMVPRVATRPPPQSQSDWKPSYRCH